MSNGLHPQFIQAVMSTLQNPGVMMDIVLVTFHPEVVKRQTEWVKTRIATTDGLTEMAAMYDFLQTQFPKAPVREQIPGMPPEEAFREMMKHAIAVAFGLEYHTPLKITIN